MLSLSINSSYGSLCNSFSIYNTIELRKWPFGPILVAKFIVSISFIIFSVKQHHFWFCTVIQLTTTAFCLLCVAFQTDLQFRLTISDSRILCPLLDSSRSLSTSRLQNQKVVTADGMLLLLAFVCLSACLQDYAQSYE